MIDLQVEDAIDPGLPIIDSHHHLRDRIGDSYLFPDLLADLATGHNIRATVAIECGDMYRAHGAPERRPLGETEFLAGIAAMSASGRYGATIVCAGIVSFADLGLGGRMQPILDAQAAVSGGRLRGIRNPVAWHASEVLRRTRVGREGLLHDRAFREGVALLAANKLSLDLWLYHPQLPDLADLARACPATTIVLNHVGGPLGAGPYEGKREEVLADWRSKLREVARCPNVFCKLGGLGMPIIGFGFDCRAAPASSAELATAWRPYIETCIEAFGVDRCMFESNFPPDKASCSYAVLWNAFKRIVAPCSPDEKSALFSSTAARVYRLGEILESGGDPQCHDAEFTRHS